MAIRLQDEYFAMGVENYNLHHDKRINDLYGFGERIFRKH